MNKYKKILFDLDGTLSDPKVGITNSVHYALKKMGIVESNLDALQGFIGPPLQDSFAEIYHFNEKESKLAVDFYRERFLEKGMYENTIYPKIPNLLEELVEKGYQCIVATSKPTVFAEKILNYFAIDRYFNTVVGSHLDGSRSSKTEIIQYVLDTYKSTELSECVMIGDRSHDIIGAKNVGIDSIAVTYGYGSMKEIKESNPTHTVHDIAELKQIL